MQKIAFLARFFAAVLGGLFCALSGHGLAFPLPGMLAISLSAMSSSASNRASINRGQSASEPVRMTKPVRVFMGTVSIITGSCGLSLPEQRHGDFNQHGGRQNRRGQLKRGQKDAPCCVHDCQSRRGAQSEAAQRRGAKAAHHRGQHDPVKAGGNHHQQAQQLKEVAHQGRLAPPSPDRAG